jgi:hypothetical protein
MYLPIPAEMINTAIEMAFCFFTVVTVLMGFVLAGRA